VHSSRLEWLGEGLAACSGETVAAHLGMVLAIEASASGNSNTAPQSPVAASRIEDDVHTSVGEPYSGSRRKP
jgi:hypothetical protein